MKQLSVYLSILFVAAFCLAQPAAAQVPAGDVFRQEGIASWYGREFDGRPTASGEIFDSSLFTAAHPTLPFGTVLLVTNRHNNLQVTVRVNDRGPFVASRIIDVSRAAAIHLDMLNTGTAPVYIESIDRIVMTDSVPELALPAGTPPPAVTPAFSVPQPILAPPAQAPLLSPQPLPQFTQSVPVFPAFSQSLPAPEYTPPQSGAKLTPAITPAPNKTYKLQVGSYKVARNAVEAFERLKGAGLNPSYERNGEYFRVVLAGVRGNDVQSTAERLELTGFHEAVIREEK